MINKSDNSFAEIELDEVEVAYKVSANT